MAGNGFAESMAKNRVLLSCFLIMALDIAAGILGVQAEIAQNKVKYLKVWIFECQDPSYHAFNLGMAAVVLLAIAHVVANVGNEFVFVRTRDELQHASSNRQLASVSIILSWVLFFIAFALLIAGALANSHRRTNCGIYNRRFLSFGGILCFIHGLFAVSYSVAAAAVVKEESKSNPNLNPETPHVASI